METAEKTHLDNHIEALKLKNVDQYVAWCINNGFSTSLNKSYKLFAKEVKFFIAQNAMNALKKRSPKKLKNIIQEIKDGANEKNYYDKLPKEIASLYNNIKTTYWKNYADTFLDVVLFLHENSKIINDTKKLSSIQRLVINKDYWIRPYKEWKAKTHNVHKQFAAFARHLLAKYEVPIFMDDAWCQQTINEKHESWFIHIGLGKNIRTAKELPFPLTKKQAHWFMKAGDNFTIIDALKYGQIMAIGGSERLFHALNPTILMRRWSSSEFDAFAQSVIKFFIDNPMLDLAHVGPICDYINNEKFVEQRVFEGNNPVYRTPQPNFSMNRRTPQSLLNGVERWHRQLGKEKKGGNLEWPHSNINEFSWKQGKADKGNLKFWDIKEATSSKELSAIGRSLSNCVGSYAHSCDKGSISIWSLTCETHMKKEVLLAIEMSMKTKQLMQIRGKFNRYPTKQETNILEKWVQKENLQFRYK